jgi:hypothetical protein
MPIVKAQPASKTQRADKSIASSQQYESDMKLAIDRQAGAQIAGVNAGAGQAIGCYQRSLLKHKVAWIRIIA